MQPDPKIPESRLLVLTSKRRFVPVWTSLIIVRPMQPSATHPHFGQSCLFTNFPNISTTIRGSQFQGIREKAGLSKMGVSCRRLVQCGRMSAKIYQRDGVWTCGRFLDTPFGRIMVKSGISGSDAMCWFFWDAMSFCNKLARWLQKIVACDDAMCWFSGMLLSFVASLPKRRFWKSEPTFPNPFSRHFSTSRSPSLVLTPLKSASKTDSERLVRTSKIFVWEG